MQFGFWQYEMILVLLYFLWGIFFTDPSYISQLVFNFAVFYPVGLIAGYFSSRKKFDVYKAALVLNILSYLLAYLMGVVLTNLVMVIVDFLSMLMFVWIGRLLGSRSKLTPIRKTK